MATNVRSSIPSFYMGVAGSLVANRRLPSEVIPPWRPVVVAHEEPRLSRQGQQSLDRAAECARIAAREVRTCSAVIRYEQRVADKTVPSGLCTLHFALRQQYNHP